MQTNFEIIARAVIIHDNKILLCKRKDRDYYFLPGGHVEFEERTEEALRREMKEELGVSIQNLDYIGLVENIYTEDGEPRHELNVIFAGTISPIITKSVEDHLAFSLIVTDQVAEQNFLPITLKNALTKWLCDKQVFWVSQQD